MDTIYLTFVEVQQRILQQKQFLADQRSQIEEIRRRVNALEAAHLQRIQEYEWQMKLLEEKRSHLRQRQPERY